MRNGYGSPYIRIFSSVGEITFNITNFVYKYSQEEDDTCDITIEDLNVNLPDRPEFQEGSVLKVTWGFIGEQESKTRTVKVASIKPKFTERMVSLDLTCTDLASDMKGANSKKIHKGTIDDMAADIAKRYNLAYNGVTRDIDIQDINGIPRPGFFNEDGNYTIAIDNVAIPRKLNLKFYEQFPQGGASDYRALRNAADGDPEGPFEVYGRDGELIVSKRNFNQKPQKIYTYGDGTGLLLSFEPETKVTRKKGATEVSTTGFDPENKTAFNLNTNGLTNLDPKLGDVIDIPINNPVDQVWNPDAGAFKAIDHGKSNYPASGTYPLNSPEGTLLISSDKDLQEISPFDLKNTESANWWTPAKHDADEFTEGNVMRRKWGLLHFGKINTASIGFFGEGDNFKKPAVDQSRVFVPTLIDQNGIPWQSGESTPEHSPDDAAGKSANAHAENAADLNPGEATVVGDPLLESGKIIGILNVSKKYSGNWYVTECTHTIKPGNPYKVTFKITRNALNSTGSDTPSKINVKAADNIPKLEKKTIVNKSLEENKEGQTLSQQLKIINANEATVNDAASAEAVDAYFNGKKGK